MPSLSRLRRAYQQHIGTSFKIGLEGDQPVINIGRETLPAKEAIDRINELKITEAHFFSPTMTPATFPGEGAGSFPQLEALAKRGYEVELIRHDTKKLAKDKALNTTIANTYGEDALVIPRDNATTVIRMHELDTGKVLSHGEIAQVMKREEGLVAFAEGNPAKRMTDMVAARQVSGRFTGSDALKVGVFDPSLMHPELDPGVARIGYEGFSATKSKTMKRIANQAARRGREIEKEIASGVLAGDDLTKAIARVESIKEEVGKIKRVAKEGGTYNVRVAGAEFVDIFDQITEDLVPGSQIKGDMGVFMDDLFEGVFGTEVDIATSIHGNVKPEFGRQLTEAGEVISTISLEAHGIQNVVRTNIQATMANPDLYDLQQMVDFQQGKIDEWFRSVMDEGQLPQGMIDHFNQLLEKDISSIGADDLGSKSIGELRRQQAFARTALSRQETGLITSDPTFLDQLGNTFSKYLTAGDEKGSFFLAPDTLGGHVRPWELYEQLIPASERPAQLLPGQLTFNKAHGWLMTAEDIAKYGPAFGGFDMDDLLQNPIRFNRETGTLKVIGQRPPTARGEISVFDIDIRDPGVREIIEAKVQLREAIPEGAAHDPNFSKTELDRLFGLESNYDELADFVEQNIVQIDSVEEIAARSIVDGEPEVWLKNIEDANVEQAKKIKKAADSIFGSLGVKDGAEMAEYGPKNVSEAIEIYEQTLFELESYSDTRLFADFMRNAHDKDLRELNPTGILSEGYEAWVHQQETVIDRMIEGVMDPNVNIAETTRDMRIAIGRTAAEFNLPIDPQLVTDRDKAGKVMADILAGAKEIDESFEIDDLLLDSTDERAYYSAWKIAKDKQMDDTRIRMKREVGKSKFLDDTFFDEAAEADADRIKEAIRMSTERSGIVTPDEIADQLDRYGVPLDPGKQRMLENDVTRVLSDMFEDDGTMGDRGRKAVGAYLQKYGKEADPFTGNLSDVKTTVLSWYETAGLDDTQLADFTPDQQKAHRALATQDISIGDMYDPEYRTGFDDISTQVDESLGAKKASRQADDYAEAASGSRGKMKEANLGDLKRLWSDSSLLRKGAVGAGALIAGSLIYQAVKDRSPEDLEGPPLLPGGSAYEGYPSPQMPAGIGNNYTPPSGSGVTYKVNVRGSHDPETLRSQLEYITGAPSSGTIYNVPNPNASLFDDIDEVFGR